MKRALLIIVCVGVLSLGASECDGATDRRQREETAMMVREAHQQIGMPDIVNFQERRIAKQILELRDTEIVTYAYIVDLNGGLHFLGEAVGYGLPYSVQFTNPERYDHNGCTLPQPDPNGLFMPDGLSATWIMLRDPDSGKVRPVYVEPQLVVSPFPLRHVDAYNER